MKNKKKLFILIILIIIGITVWFGFSSNKIPAFIDKLTGMKVYTDPTGVLFFKYKENFTVVNGAQKLTNDWRINTDTPGIVLAVVNVPKSYMPNTNFSEAKITIGRSNDPTAIALCPTPGAYETGTAATSVNVKGIPFKKFTSGDAGAGNFYETTSYRAIYDGDCYAVEYTIHYTNIDNYSPDQGVVQFNKTQIVNNLEKTVHSLRFLISSN